jgi:hypothetical protein
MLSETDVSDNGGLQARRPYWPIGLALLGLVIAVLGAAVLLDHQLRPRVGVEPLATVQVAAEATPPQTAAPPAVAASPPAGGASSATLLEAEVGDAYRRYWLLYSEALFTLETSRLGEVAADEELSRTEDEVHSFQARARAVRVDVDHNFILVDINDTAATLYDEITDRSFLIDPATKEPSRGPDSAHVVKDIFYLKKVDGAWKVTKSLRQEG